MVIRGWVFEYGLGADLPSSAEGALRAEWSVEKSADVFERGTIERRTAGSIVIGVYWRSGGVRAVEPWIGRFYI